MFLSWEGSHSLITSAFSLREDSGSEALGSSTPGMYMACSSHHFLIWWSSAPWHSRSVAFWMFERALSVAADWRANLLGDQTPEITL